MKIFQFLFILIFCLLLACQKESDLTLYTNGDTNLNQLYDQTLSDFEGNGMSLSDELLILKSDMMRRRGGALLFDGVDDYVRVPDDPSLDLTTGFTVAAWIYIEEYVEWASIVTKGGLPADAGDANNYTIHQSGPDGGGAPEFATEFGHLRFTGDGASLPTPLPENTSIIPTEEWHFVCVTFDGSTMKFYLDGNSLDGQYAVEGPLTTNDDPLYIGVDFPGGDEFWKGMLDELKIWNVALNSGQVNAVMRGRATPGSGNLAGYWSFDEGSGTTANDLSGNGNHGELIGGVAWVSL